MLKKTAGNRCQFLKEKKGESCVVSATGSVQTLNGLFRRRRSKPVSIEEMDAAIAKGVAAGMRSSQARTAIANRAARRRSYSNTRLPEGW